VLGAHLTSFHSSGITHLQPGSSTCSGVTHVSAEGGQHARTLSSQPSAPTHQPSALTPQLNLLACCSLRDALTLPPILIVSRERQRGFSSRSSFSSLSPSILPRTSYQTTSAIFPTHTLSSFPAGPPTAHWKPKAIVVENFDFQKISVYLQT